MAVTVLYFIMMGLTITTKMAQDAELIKVIKSPAIVSLPTSKFPRYRKIINAPATAKVRPEILSTVILSFKMINVKINTMMGFEIMIMEELIGVVILNP